jgi:hypothetical protein
MFVCDGHGDESDLDSNEASVKQAVCLREGAQRVRGKMSKERRDATTATAAKRAAKRRARRESATFAPSQTEDMLQGEGV